MDTLVGKLLLDRYRVVSRIGQGGWSVVFRARDERLERNVAIKVFTGVSHSARTVEKSKRHFVQEAFALSRLNHPHTLRIFDFGALEGEDGVPFQVSEYMDGGTLASRIDKHGPLQPQRALAIAASVAGALHEAHERGIVHRDVKPTNILFRTVGATEVVKLADFSIAQWKASPASEDDDDAPLLFCSLGWSAPEQTRRAEVDRTVDVYGLGLVIAYMITGKRLKVHQRLSDFRWPPERHDAAVQRALDKCSLPDVFREVVRRAVRGRPEERFPTATALVEAFEAAVLSEAQTAPTPRSPASAPITSLDSPADSVDVDTASIEVEPPTVASLRTVAEPSAIPLDPSAPMLPDGRRLHLRPVDREAVLEGRSVSPALAPRLRVTLLPSHGGEARAHLRGLNCFVRRAGGSPTGAVDLVDDGEIQLLTQARRPCGTARVSLGRKEGGRFVVTAAGSRFVLPAGIEDPVVVELPAGDAFLLHRA